MSSTRNNGKWLAIGLGTFLIIWIVAQVWWMGVHWLHFLYIILGIVELVLGSMLRKKMRTAG